MNAIATTPEAIIAAIQSLGDCIRKFYSITAASPEVYDEARNRLNAAAEAARAALDGVYTGSFSVTHHMSDYDATSHHVTFMVGYRLYSTSVDVSIESHLGNVRWLSDQIAAEWAIWTKGNASVEYKTMKEAEAIFEAVKEELESTRIERNEAARPLFYAVGDMVSAKQDFRTKDRATGKFITHSRGLTGKAIWIGDDSYNPGTKRTGFQLANGTVIYTTYGNLIKAGTFNQYNNTYLPLVDRLEALNKSIDEARTHYLDANRAYDQKVPKDTLEAVERVYQHHKAA